MIGEGGMKIGRRNRNTRRKPAPAPLCPPQIPLDQTRDRTRAAGVESRRLTAWAMARPTQTTSYKKWQWGLITYSRLMFCYTGSASSSQPVSCQLLLQPSCSQMRSTRREGGWRKERLWWTPKEIVWPVGGGRIRKISTQMCKQLKRDFFLDVTPCSLREVYWCIGGLDLLTYLPALRLMLPIYLPFPHEYYISCRAQLKILREECILGNHSFYDLFHSSLTSSHLGLNVLQHHFVLKYISLCSFLWKK
jgi:hypothetical protein